MGIMSLFKRAKIEDDEPLDIEDFSDGEEKHHFAEYLISKGLVNDQVARAAIMEQSVSGELIGAILLKNGYIMQKDLAEAILAFRPDNIANERVSNSRIPVDELKERKIIISAVNDSTIFLATAGDEDEVRELLKIHYPDKRNVKFVAFMAEAFDDFIERIEKSSTETAPTEDVESSDMLERILMRSFKEQASDIHIEPKTSSYSVFYRKLGVRDLVYEGSIDEYLTVSTQIKDRARMDIAETKMPQDGGYKVEYNNKFIDLRVATLPTVEGKEKIVIRILDPDRINPALETLGITRLPHWKEAISRKNGICLICGETGSGKTTTLNATIRGENRIEKAIYTAEDPVEYRIHGVAQVNINPAIGLSFPRVQRAFMRLDPEIMVLGEVRDQETARNAVQGADTGHMVFATLHTATIASSLTRLRALGVEPHEMRLILRGVLVQALVRTLCKVCEGTGTFEGHRCPNPLCHGTGYGARTIISECTSFKSPEDVDECIALLNEQPTDANGKKQPVKMPWPSMIDDAIDKMVAGETTSNELKRIFGSELDDRLRQRRLDPDHYILPKLRDKH